MTSIGNRISNLRKKHGYTQEKLAELADISIQFLSDIENNKKSMTVTTLKNIADSLNITTDYIIYGRKESIENSIIIAMLNTLSDNNRKKAEKLLEIFVSAVNDEAI